jgi:hypothetical protein
MEAKRSLNDANKISLYEVWQQASYWAASDLRNDRQLANHVVSSRFVGKSHDNSEQC